MRREGKDEKALNEKKYRKKEGIFDYYNTKSLKNVHSRLQYRKFFVILHIVRQDESCQMKTILNLCIR